jgi:hypothetical protein
MTEITAQIRGLILKVHSFGCTGNWHNGIPIGNETRLTFQVSIRRIQSKEGNRPLPIGIDHDLKSLKNLNRHRAGSGISASSIGGRYEKPFLCIEKGKLRELLRKEPKILCSLENASWELMESSTKREFQGFSELLVRTNARPKSYTNQHRLFGDSSSIQMRSPLHLPLNV